MNGGELRGGADLHGGRDRIDELLLEKSKEAIQQNDLSEGRPFLEEDFGIRSILGWVQHKFGIELKLDEIKSLEPEDLKEQVRNAAEKAYDEKESEYPVMAGLYRFSTAAGSGQSRIDRDELIAWARERFEVDLDLEDLKNKQREEIRAILIGHSQANQQRAAQTLTVVEEKIESLFASSDAGHTAGHTSGGNGALTSLADWSKQTLHCDLSADELAKLHRDELEQKLRTAVANHYHPEMRRMERAVLLQIVDTAWKDHLLTMDYLRSAVGLKGYAQLDPKVEYKREGMQLFEEMWNSIDERVTDLIFRMEQLDEEFVGSTWVETSARHDEAQSASDIAQQQQQAISSSQGETKIEPFRNRGAQIRRNDPCPCGSGKKYKNCCMRKGKIV